MKTTQKEIKYIEIKTIRTHRSVRKDFGDLEGLMKSISSNDLFHPILVDSDNILIVGRRRLEACKRLGWETIPAIIIDTERPLIAQLHENAFRKDHTPSEMVE
ncbi:ParB N-terminal domain-containing protein, partial [bacterium]|nr:ParB N-terminal domain-containing protein [bacterium]